MVAILVPKFKVKSDIHNYTLEFINKLSFYLNSEISYGDVVIVDDKILSYYPSIKACLKNKKLIKIRSTENIKNYKNIIPIIKKIINHSFKKKNKLIAIGGGITQDVTSFIATILFRGVDWIFFPTTLISQADSCIGSKTSINFGNYKNQIGSFYPPKKIFIYTNFLKSLSKEDIFSGLGEISHYLIIDSKKSFQCLINYFLNPDSKNLKIKSLILKNLMIKKKFIEQDEFDLNKRNILNYGHTFGHAIESVTKYKIPHGIAVSIGIDIVNYISVKKGFLKEIIRNEMKETLKILWKNYNLKKINANKIFLAIKEDKKSDKKFIKLILCRDYGDCFIKKMLFNKILKNLINDYFVYGGFK